jgi:GcrA cell cycle regulator
MSYKDRIPIKAFNCPQDVMATKTKPKKATGPKKLLDLEKHDCRWPIGEPRHPDFHFCGARQLQNRPYCELHWRMAFQPPRPRHQPAIATPSQIANAA